MFTSRAEYRLHLRSDNADLRLTEKGYGAGCVGAVRWASFKSRVLSLDLARQRLEGLAMSPNQLYKAGIEINLDGARRNAMQVLAYPNVTVEDAIRVWPEVGEIKPEIAAQLKIEATYSRYLERQEADIRALRRDIGLTIPDDLDFNLIPGLSAEVKLKLGRARPASLGAAARIAGVTPAAITVLLAFIKKRETGARRLSA